MSIIESSISSLVELSVEFLLISNVNKSLFLDFIKMNGNRQKQRFRCEAHVEERPHFNYCEMGGRKMGDRDVGKERKKIDENSGPH